VRVRHRRSRIARQGADDDPTSEVPRKQLPNCYLRSKPGQESCRSCCFCVYCTLGTCLVDFGAQDTIHGLSPKCSRQADPPRPGYNGTTPRRPRGAPYKIQVHVAAVRDAPHNPHAVAPKKNRLCIVAAPCQAKTSRSGTFRDSNCPLRYVYVCRLAYRTQAESHPFTKRFRNGPSRRPDPCCFRIRSTSSVNCRRGRTTAPSFRHPLPRARDSIDAQRNVVWLWKRPHPLLDAGVLRRVFFYEPHNDNNNDDAASEADSYALYEFVLDVTTDLQAVYRWRLPSRRVCSPRAGRRARGRGRGAEVADVAGPNGRTLSGFEDVAGWLCLGDGGWRR
jgi:hypothetical protein